MPVFMHNAINFQNLVLDQSSINQSINLPLRPDQGDATPHTCRAGGRRRPTSTQAVIDRSRSVGQQAGLAMLGKRKASASSSTKAKAKTAAPRGAQRGATVFCLADWPGSCIASTLISIAFALLFRQDIRDLDEARLLLPWVASLSFSFEAQS